MADVNYPTDSAIVDVQTADLLAHVNTLFPILYQQLSSGKITFEALKDAILNGIQTQLDAHEADDSVHYLKSAIDHAQLLSIGSYSHASIDNHINNSTLHGTPNPDWANILNKPSAYPPSDHDHTEADISDLSIDHHIIIADVKPFNSGGGSFLSGARRVRDLNSILLDESGLVTLNNNQFTLPAGTYDFSGQAPAMKVNNHQAYLYNVSEGLDEGMSAISCAHANDNTQTYSHFFGKISLTSPKTFEIQHYCIADYADYGFGAYTSFGSSIYTSIHLRRVTHGS